MFDMSGGFDTLGVFDMLDSLRRRIAGLQQAKVVLDEFDDTEVFASSAAFLFFPRVPGAVDLEMYVLNFLRLCRSAWDSVSWRKSFKMNELRFR